MSTIKTAIEHFFNSDAAKFRADVGNILDQKINDRLTNERVAVAHSMLADEEITGEE